MAIPHFYKLLHIFVQGRREKSILLLRIFQLFMSAGRRKTPKEENKIVKSFTLYISMYFFMANIFAESRTRISSILFQIWKRGSNSERQAKFCYLGPSAANIRESVPDVPLCRRRGRVNRRRCTYSGRAYPHPTKEESRNRMKENSRVGAPT